jgi:hypothetical protein
VTSLLEFFKFAPLLGLVATNDNQTELLAILERLRCLPRWACHVRYYRHFPAPQRAVFQKSASPLPARREMTFVP